MLEKYPLNLIYYKNSPTVVDTLIKVLNAPLMFQQIPKKPFINGVSRYILELHVEKNVMGMPDIARPHVALICEQLLGSNGKNIENERATKNSLS